MASKIDQAFIDNLQNFTTALEGIVELLKQQSDKGDAINKLASAMDGDKISQLTEDIKNILNATNKIDKRTEEILKEVKSARKQKESGLFGDVQDKSNKNKIVDGVGVIMLIAGGVLAIGMAFKIIGKVDFLSVIALSGGILMISYAFAKIAEIKDLTPKKMLIVGLSVISMATAITISSWILQLFKPVGALQMFSFIVVSTALGVGAYFIMKAVSALKIEKPQDVLKFLLLPIILPAIAAGITLSSWILMLTAPVNFKQAISAIFVGAILAVGAIAIMFVMKAVKGVKISEMLMSTLMIPLIALGIVWASNIFQDFQPISNPLDILVGSLAMGISLLAFAPTVWLLGKLDLKSMLIGALAIPIVSLAIVAASWILTLGKYDSNYPGIGWALGVGLSLFAFAVPTLMLGLLAITGIGALAIVLGAGLTLVVSAAIVGSSLILSKGVYGNYPGLGWALGTGLSLVAFGTGMVALGLIPFAGKILERGNELVKYVAQSISDVSYILKGGDYTGGPTKEWAEGIGLSLGAFAHAASVSMKDKTLFSSGELDPEVFGNFMVSIANSMIRVAEVLKKGDWSGKAPSKEWGEGISTSIMPFIEAYKAINERKSVLDKFFGGGAKNDSFGDLMVRIAWGMRKVAEVLKGGDFTGGPNKDWSENISKSIGAFTESIGQIDDKKVKVLEKFSDVIKELGKNIKLLNDSGLDKLNKLTASVTIISVIDNQKLKETLNVLNDNKDKLSNLIEKNNYTPTTSRQESLSISNTGNVKSINEFDDQKEMNKKFDTLLSKFDELLEIMVKSKSGENVSSNDKIV